MVRKLWLQNNSISRQPQLSSAGQLRLMFSRISSPESFDFDIRSSNDQKKALQLDYIPASATEWRHIDESPMFSI